MLIVVLTPIWDINELVLKVKTGKKNKILEDVEATHNIMPLQWLK